MSGLEDVLVKLFIPQLSLATGHWPLTRMRPPWTARVWSGVLAAVGVFLGLCLVTYHPADVSFLSSHPQAPPLNLGGSLGVWVGFVGRSGFGWASLIFSVLCLFWAWRLWRSGLPEFHGVSLAVAALSLAGSAGTLLALGGADEGAQTALGGLAGFLLVRAGTYYLGNIGTVLTALSIGGLSWLVVGQTLTLSQASGEGRSAPPRQGAKDDPSRVTLRVALPPRGDAAASEPVQRPGVGSRLSALLRRPRDAGASNGGAGKPASPEHSAPQRATVPQRVAAPRVRMPSTVEPTPKVFPTPPRPQAPGGFQLPSLDLLSNPPPIAERHIADDLQMNARMLEETLREFGVDAAVVNVDRGPTVTRYELAPSPGVKLTRIVSLADDLALVMKAASCHVVAPIPGKGLVGVDVPNSTTTVVYLKEIVTAHEFTSHASPLALPIGKDVSGQPIVADLRDCPHLLIAGATGSGKTVCLNSLLVGIVTRASPEQVKFLMIDPKMVELAMFNDIPHLVAPVVTSAKKSSAALGWAVEEMERRYERLASAGVRNIEAYNKRASANGGTPAAAPRRSGDAEASVPGSVEDDGRPLPYLVIVIDELADLMMVASQDIEGAITRLAQLSRAVGLHMVLATQRPSVDVITGVIKANFPARIAFQVASKVDSRTILDVNGADKLVGRGDLLFLRPGTAKPIRAQGAFVTDAEIEQVTAFLKRQRAPSYDGRLLERARQPEGALSGEKDELYEMAKQLVLATGQASTSLLQRRLRLGYGRAARILDLMEQEGLIGPPQGSRPREVLVSREAVGSERESA